MVSPLDPWIEAFSTDPLTGLILIATMALVMVGPEILTARLYLRGMLSKKVRKDVRAGFLEDVENGSLDPALKRVTAPIEARIQEVEGRLEELDKTLETRLDEISIEPVQVKLEELDEALGKHFTTIHAGLESLPARVRSSLEGSEGAQMKKLYAQANEAETEILEEYEAALGPEDLALARLDDLSHGEGLAKYEKKHEIGGFLVRGALDYLKAQLQSQRGNVVTMGRVAGPKGKFPSVYG